MGQGPIPHDKVVEYGVRAGLDDENVDALVEIVRTMDKAYLEWCADETKRTAKIREANKGAKGQ